MKTGITKNITPIGTNMDMIEIKKLRKKFDSKVAILQELLNCLETKKLNKDIYEFLIYNELPNGEQYSSTDYVPSKHQENIEGLTSGIWDEVNCEINEIFYDFFSQLSKRELNNMIKNYLLENKS